MQGLQGIASYAWYHTLFLLFDRFPLVLFCTTFLWFQTVQYYHEWEKFLLLQGSFLVFIRSVLLVIMSLGIIFFSGHYFLYDYCLAKRLEARAGLMQTKKKHLISWKYEPEMQSWIRVVSGVVDRSIIDTACESSRKIFLLQKSTESVYVDELRKNIKPNAFYEAVGAVIVPLILSLLYLFLFRLEYFFVVSSFLVYVIYWSGVCFFEADAWWNGMWGIGLFVLGIMSY